jgi:hypothetical protein
MLKLIHAPEIRKALGRSAQERISGEDSPKKFAEAIQSTLKSCLAQEGIERIPASPEGVSMKGAIP